MIYKHLILEVNGEKALYLYLDYSYELASEPKYSKRENSIINKISHYIQSNHIDYSKKNIMLVVNNIIIGKINLDDNLYDEYINNFEKEKIDIIDKYDEPELVKNYDNTLPYEIDKFIKTSNNKKDNDFISFTTYLIYLMSNEIPASYEDEALKVYAILSRTNIVKILSERGSVHVNVNFYNKALKNLWNEKYDYYLNKLKKIISDTNHLVLFHKNNYFDKLFYNSKYHVPLTAHIVNNLAKSGYSYKNILKYFYPDCILVNKSF